MRPLIAPLVVASGALAVFVAAPVLADGGDLDEIEAIAVATTVVEPTPPPPPECWWENVPSTPDELARWQAFWRQIDGGDHVDEIIIFAEDGTIQQTVVTTETTYVLQVRICTDPADDRHGRQRWEETGPPNPTSLWTELTERVTRRVPTPDWDLGMTPADDGSVEVVINLGLWIAVTNSADVVARAEPAAGVWSEARATLDRIEFDPGTGAPVVTCTGAGTVAPNDLDSVDEGPCGHTYRDVADLGEHTATVRAIWHVTTSASTGESARQPDIVLEATIPVTVVEIQTVGTGN